MRYFKLQKLEFKQLIDDITINLWSPWNFVSIKNIWIYYNLTVDLSKFTLNLEIWVWVQVTLDVILKNVTLTDNLLLNSYFENPTIGSQFLFFLTCMPILMPIGCNLLFDL